MRVPSRIASLRGGGSNYSLGIRYPVKSGPVGPWDPQWADGLQKKRLAAMRDGRSWSSVSARNATFTEGMFAWLQCIFGSGARAMFASCLCAGDHTAPASGQTKVMQQEMAQGNSSSPSGRSSGDLPQFFRQALNRTQNALSPAFRACIRHWPKAALLACMHLCTSSPLLQHVIGAADPRRIPHLAHWGRQVDAGIARARQVSDRFQLEVAPAAVRGCARAGNATLRACCACVAREGPRLRAVGVAGVKVVVGQARRLGRLRRLTLPALAAVFAHDRYVTRRYFDAKAKLEQMARELAEVCMYGCVCV